MGRPTKEEQAAKAEQEKATGIDQAKPAVNTEVSSSEKALPETNGILDTRPEDQKQDNERLDLSEYDEALKVPTIFPEGVIIGSEGSSLDLDNPVIKYQNDLLPGLSVDGVAHEQHSPGNGQENTAIPANTDGSENNLDTQEEQQAAGRIIKQDAMVGGLPGGMVRIYGVNFPLDQKENLLKAGVLTELESGVVLLSATENEFHDYTDNFVTTKDYDMDPDVEKSGVKLGDPKNEETFVKYREYVANKGQVTEKPIYHGDHLDAQQIADEVDITFDWDLVTAPEHLLFKP